MQQIVPNDIDSCIALRDYPQTIGKGQPHPGYGPEYWVADDWTPPAGFILTPHKIEYGPDEGLTVFLMKSMNKFPYFTGCIATGSAPTPGEWENGVFTTPDGSRWVMIDPTESTADGNDTVWLKPA